jgi:hypothetical protein
MTKLILIIGGLYIFFTYVLPFLTRLFLGRALKNAQEAARKTQQRGDFNWQTDSPKSNPKSTRSTASGKKTILDDSDGDYVDYEEIK